MKKKMWVEDSFWSGRVEQMVQEIIPYQYQVLNDQVAGTPKSHAIENFRIAASLSADTYQGMLFQDSDVAKWIEAAAYALMIKENPTLEEQVDGLVELLAKAQQKDGYLNTYYTCVKPGERFSNIAHGHELYCAGHLLEAAVAYAEATGKEKFIDIMKRYIDYLMSEIGMEEGKRRIYSGHPEIELALYRLYCYDGDERYLQFMKYMLTERGRQPSFLETDSGFGERYRDKWFGLSYHQAHQPLTEQREAVGHAVRAVYLYAGMADLAFAEKDSHLLNTLKVLWEDVTLRKMYLSGAIGAEAHGESFSAAYDLPNDRAYGETCASIGLIFWARRMLKMERNSSYSDVMELALYNSAISGMSADGKRYFYVNPLSMMPQEVNSRYDLRHIEPTRVTWFGCACCPPNLARLIASLDKYIYDYDSTVGKLDIHLYIGGRIILEGDDCFRITGDYLRDGWLNFTYQGGTRELELAMRIPGWCEYYRLEINGMVWEGAMEHGYVKINRQWNEGDVLQLAFVIKPRLVHANPRVAANGGRVAIMRGPLLYCLEEADNESCLNGIMIEDLTDCELVHDDRLPSGDLCLSFNGWREDMAVWEKCLYQTAAAAAVPVRLKAVPYHAWGNRGVGEMLVWVREWTG